MTEQLNNPYNRTVSGDAPAWSGYPKEQKICVITEPLCNQYIKERNYYMARPYNFMLYIEQWGNVKNKIELLMAIRFGMEWDTNKLADGNLYDPAFHTQMYIRFHNYVLKQSLKEIPKIVGEFEQTAFKVRFLSVFAVDELRELRNLEPFAQGKGALKSLNDLKKTISKLNVVSATRDLSLLVQNKGPLHINRDMFKKVFNQDYNPRMVQILRDEGVYTGDPLNVERAEFESKFGR
ncbi:hypothetical protein [Acinetobacter ihumii]|uniref:hypothetical protein n=1 Tax=Acinetobacter ihumii TaxID=2483802 RepID=UPI003D750EE1